MKTAIKLVLVYFAMQILGILLVVPFSFPYAYFRYGILELSPDIYLAPALFAGMLLMIGYLWKRGYLKNDGHVYSPVSASAVTWGLLATVSIILLTEALMNVLTLPDLMENTFEDLQKTWIGIFSIVLLGPLLEELLFRSAITKTLLQHYTPLKAILISGVIFGVFHINPVQVVGASFFGFFSAWLYYRTGSIVPGFLGHVLNNGLSVYVSLTHPDMESVSDLMTGGQYTALLITAASLLVLACYMLCIARFPRYEYGGNTD